LIRFSRALAVGQRGPVGPQADSSSGRISITVSHFAIGGVVVNHGVHVSGADSEKQTWLTESAPILTTPPIRLGNDADAEAGGFEGSAQNGHGETRMINVGIARNKDDIQLVPATLPRLFHRHRQRDSCRRGWLSGPFERFQTHALFFGGVDDGEIH
jgi:transcription elongation factor